MNTKFISIVTGLIGLSIGLSIPTFLKGYCTETSKLPTNLSNPDNYHPVLSEAALYRKAESITVKVLSGQTSGSGIIIHEQGQLYTVVTNYHVLIFGTQNQFYQIQTPDGQIYPSKLVNTINFKNHDLGLLQFRSAKNYLIAFLSESVKPIEGEEVFAAGFPSELDKLSPRRFVFTKGNITMLNDQAFGGGYKIGSTNSIKKGMSGGPLLNRRGEIVGINGVHKYPLWGNPYQFQDGSLASPDQKKRMSQLSWAIPIQTLLNLTPQFASTR